MNTLEEIIEYFENLCPFDINKVAVNQSGSHKNLGNFFYGDEDTLSDAVVAKAVYPLLFLETIETDISEAIQEAVINLHICKTAKIADYKQQKAAQGDCYNIALSLWALFRKHHKEGLARFSLKCKISAVYYVSVANLTGVKMQFTLLPKLDVCFNPLEFN